MVYAASLKATECHPPRHFCFGVFMSTLAKLERITAKRVPAARKGNRVYTDEFLEYFERRNLASLDAARQLSLTDTSDALKGQILYWQHCVSCIKWLREMNQQRRDHA